MKTLALVPHQITLVVVPMLVAGLSGCGAEVATTAGTVGATQAEAARQAQVAKDKAVEGVGAALKAAQQRASGAEGQ